MSDTMTKKDIVVELIKSMTPEQRQQLLTEDFKAEFERELIAEIDKRAKQKSAQGECAAGPSEADQGE